MTRPQRAAVNLMEECGIDDPTEIPLELIVEGRGATIRSAPLSGSDGRIVFGETSALITINDAIPYEGKRRFTIAHELGHYELHRNAFQHHHDTDASLEFYFKEGNQETEANQFASELLMPEKLFKGACAGQRFGPEILRSLADRFQTSITSVAYKFFGIGNHPICLVYSRNGVVEYRKWPPNYPHFLRDLRRLPPPEYSVAREFFDDGIRYRPHEGRQRVWKSEWFELGRYESDDDSEFYEYCIITPQHNTVLSIIWEP